MESIGVFYTETSEGRRIPEESKGAKGAVDIVKGWDLLSPIFLPVSFKRPLPIDTVVPFYIYVVGITFQAGQILMEDLQCPFLFFSHRNNPMARANSFRCLIGCPFYEEIPGVFLNKSIEGRMMEILHPIRGGEPRKVGGVGNRRYKVSVSSPGELVTEGARVAILGKIRGVDEGKMSLKNIPLLGIAKMAMGLCIGEDEAYEFTQALAFPAVGYSHRGGYFAF